jgi:hypothetical protein
MRLVYLVANMAWCVVWHDQIIKLHNAESRFYMDKKQAISDLRECGLYVNRDGRISS